MILRVERGEGGMNIFELMKENAQEQIAFYTDVSSGLRGMCAIHSTALGPAIGGVRIMQYRTVEEALFDLVRLSRAMTYKTAAAGLNFGGGEVVIIDRGMEKGEALFRALGRFVESFKGRLVVGGDIGTTEESMEYMRMETSYVTGLPSYFGGSGDHDSMCAYGTFLGILAAAQFRWQSTDISGKKVLIQGYGRTGSRLAVLLKEVDAQVLITDTDNKKLKQAGTDGFPVIEASAALKTACAVFAPCAVGGVINEKSIESFQCEIIAGSANNQLLSEDGDLALRERDIIWAPDFIINAGGIIDVVEEYIGYNSDKVKKKVEKIYDRTLEILNRAYNEDRSVLTAALEYAEQRISSIKNLRGTFRGKGRV